jgi:hypothetical protein
MRMPNYPKADHLRQQALYSKLYDKPTALLYASPKKTMFYELSNEDIKMVIMKYLITLNL